MLWRTPPTRQVRIAVMVAFHQSAGSCSAQPGCGCISGYSIKAEARTCPSSAEKRAALTPVVPRSMPSRVCMLSSLAYILKSHNQFKRLHEEANTDTVFKGGSVQGWLLQPVKNRMLNTLII